MYSHFPVNLTARWECRSSHRKLRNRASARGFRTASCIEHASVIEAVRLASGILGYEKKNARELSWSSRGWACGNAFAYCVLTKVISYGCAKAAHRHARWSKINDRQSLLSTVKLQNIIDECINFSSQQMDYFARDYKSSKFLKEFDLERILLFFNYSFIIL